MVRKTDYPTGNENGMSFICNRWVFTGPEGYRVVPQTDERGGFLVVRYNAAETHPVWLGSDDSMHMTEDEAHELAARMAKTTPHPPVDEEKN